MRRLLLLVALLSAVGFARAQSCYLGERIPTWQVLLRPDDPQAGNPQAELVIVEYFDPNCPHCRRFYPTLKALVSEYGLVARFVFKPIPLWQFSIDQVAALLEASRQGRFEALLALQYENQRRGGLPRQTLLALAGQAGMDTGTLQQALDQKTYLQRMLEDRRLAVEAGIRGVPALIIGGRLAHHDYSFDCLQRLVEQVLQQQP